MTTAKIISALDALRKDCLEISPQHYNSLIAKVKDLGRENLWQEVRLRALGLISCGETLRSAVTKEEAAAFLLGEEPAQDEVPVAPPLQADEDYDDLLDDL